MGDARGGFRGAAAAGRAARRRAAGGARAGLGVGLGRARGGAAAGGGVRRGPALPALRRHGVAALGPRERAAPLPLRDLPQDLQRADRHLAGAAAQEGVLAALRRGARGRDDAGQGGRALRRAPDDQLPLAAPLPAGPAAAREALAGVVEADETFFRRSHKGSRRWRRGAAPPGRGPHRRGERASKRGLSAEQVPALVARDRAGHTVDAVLPDLGAEAIKVVLAPVVAGDAVLCSDGAKAYAAFAAERGHAPRAGQSRGRRPGARRRLPRPERERLPRPAEGLDGPLQRRRDALPAELSRLATNPGAGARAKRLENLARAFQPHPTALRL